jgi:thioredoxin 1
MLCFGGVCLPLLPFLLLFIQPILNLLPGFIINPIKAFFARIIAAVLPGFSKEKNEEHAHSAFVSSLSSELELKEHPVAIVKFGASWCPPCRRVAPDYAQIAEEYQTSAEFFSVDVDASPSLAQGVSSIPAFAVYRKGIRQGDLFVGADVKKLKDFVVKAIASK